MVPRYKEIFQENSQEMSEVKLRLVFVWIIALLDILTPFLISCQAQLGFENDQMWPLLKEIHQKTKVKFQTSYPKKGNYSSMC